MFSNLYQIFFFFNDKLNEISIIMKFSQKKIPNIFSHFLSNFRIIYLTNQLFKDENYIINSVTAHPMTGLMNSPSNSQPTNPDENLILCFSPLFNKST